MNRQRTKKYLARLRSRVIRSERIVARAKENLDADRAFWRSEMMEYDRESLALKRRVV